MSAEEKVKSMSVVDLLIVWEALRDYDPLENYDENTTMDEWASLVYTELIWRKIK